MPKGKSAGKAPRVAPYNICSKFTKEELEKICCKGNEVLDPDKEMISQNQVIKVDEDGLTDYFREFSDLLGPCKDFSSKPKASQRFLKVAADLYEENLGRRKYEHCCTQDCCEGKVQELLGIVGIKHYFG